MSDATMAKYVAEAVTHPNRITKCTVSDDYVWFEEYQHRGALEKRMCIARSDVSSSELLLALLREAPTNEVVVATTKKEADNAS